MSRRAWLIVAVVVIVFGAGITVGVTVLGNRSSAAAVTLEPNTSTGTDPFTSSVAISAAAMSANVQGVTAAARKTLSTNPKTHTLVATGTAPTWSVPQRHPERYAAKDLAFRFKPDPSRVRSG